MGRGAETNTGTPWLRGPGEYELSWGADHVTASWHVSTASTDGSHVTKSQLNDIRDAASQQDEATLDAAFASSNAASCWTRAKTAAGVNGLPGLYQSCYDRYAHAGDLDSEWVTG